MHHSYKKSDAKHLSLGSTIRRLGISIVLAIVLSHLLIIILPDYLIVLFFVILWPTLFYFWPDLRRRLTFLNSSKAPAPRRPRPPTPNRPLWLRLVRGTLAWTGGILLMLFLTSMIVIVPIALCHHRAERARDTVQIGMTVPEVLHTVSDCDTFGASSNFPYDEKTDADNIPAMHLGRGRDGTYRTYDLATHQDIRMSEAEAIERLHAKLHDGYQWHFYYTYINMTPMHISFSVVFGPDGRVKEVKPVQSWD